MRLWLNKMDSNKIILTKVVGDKKVADNYINLAKLNGFYIKRFKEFLAKSEDSQTISNILSNSYQAIYNFKNPTGNINQYSPIKILCLGKVQSGKTSFFLASTALAFDNGYDIAYILAGTKLKLKDQNFNRLVEGFKNNEKVKIFNLNSSFKEDIKDLIKQGCKIILVVLKNPAENTNLGKMMQLAKLYSGIPSIVIDDEGDEFTPGAPKSKKRGISNKTHDNIVDIITSFKICTFLSVTATPQANLLISTYDHISPDRALLVKPGKNYTGGRSFFDTIDNPHIKVIDDNDDFENSIPDSFKEALYLFIFSCALKRAQGDYKPFSMLVHPSSFNKIQDIVGLRIKKYINTTITSGLEDKNSIYFDDLKTEISKCYKEYYELNNGIIKIEFKKIVDELSNVVKNLNLQVINHNNIEKEKTNFLYNIKVGGNMLGRGLTLDRLIVSYIYRDSKEAQVDTMYQRCRWFGYKNNYFDICRVFMTKELQRKFMAIVSNEDHMWNALQAFLESNLNLKQFKRTFLLEHDNLVLTRKSVSNTVSLKVISYGNKEDLSVELTNQQKEHNRNLYLNFCKKYGSKGKLIDFDTSQEHNQRHLLLKLSFNEFYNEFLSKLVFGFTSPFSLESFAIINNRIKQGLQSDEILIMLMRYQKGQYRSYTDSTNTSIKRLFQGQNHGTKFSGDRYPVDINGNDYTNIPFIQIHMVDIFNKMPIFESCIPLITFNNPLTSQTIKLVTGDNVYE
ncbi:Z1 domain [Mycoplasmopsis bovirhinis]|uniref:Z1 domain n=2 Tax=Mycoplasmopsis bovirhinis TaxID=29553 RepID=A0A449AEW1_9BACT|nr:Z1 domain [Mycoplasmopsis bovirhinis]